MLNPGTAARSAAAVDDPRPPRAAGDVLRLLGPCGGGYGPPASATRRRAARRGRRILGVTSLSTRTLAGDLLAAARIGAVPEGGINRFAWTPELAEVTEWVGDELTRLGLEVEIDAAGNLLGRWPAPDGPAVMTASHLDTVPNGGRFDGVLGVLAASRRFASCGRGLQPARPDLGGRVHGRGGHAVRHGAVRQPRVRRRGSVRGSRGARQRTDVRSPRRWRYRAATSTPSAEACGVDDVGHYLELHIEQGRSSSPGRGSGSSSRSAA